MNLTDFAYRRLLALYPDRFRARFADEMLQTFRDQVADRRESGAPLGTGFWLATVADEAPAVVREQAASLRNEPVTPRVALRTALALPLFFAFYAALVSISRALPHPPVQGLGFTLALCGLLGGAALLSRTTLRALAPR